MRQDARGVHADGIAPEGFDHDVLERLEVGVLAQEVHPTQRSIQDNDTPAHLVLFWLRPRFRSFPVSALRTTEVYFERKHEDADVAARRIQIRVTDERASKPIAWSKYESRPVDVPALLEERRGFVLRWMVCKKDPNRDPS
jgi:hypothetical protein